MNNMYFQIRFEKEILKKLATPIKNKCHLDISLNRFDTNVMNYDICYENDSWAQRYIVFERQKWYRQLSKEDAFCIATSRCQCYIWHLSVCLPTLTKHNSIYCTCRAGQIINILYWNMFCCNLCGYTEANILTACCMNAKSVNQVSLITVAVKPFGSTQGGCVMLLSCLMEQPH